MLRTHSCAPLGVELAGQCVTLCGWVDTIREHKGVIFVSLRDFYGFVQVLCVQSTPGRDELVKEATFRIDGEVRARPPGSERPGEPSGMIEVEARAIKLLGPCKTLPFEIGDPVSDDLRLRYRYLDIRRREMVQNLVARHRAVQSVRRSLESQGFIEIETPMLVQPTPEGSRDFVVPSRLYPGHGYALPQSPQLYKQILMVGGIDRYYSVPRCFRDEDPRRGRQLVHTQIDLEMSFAQEEDVYHAIESLLRAAYKDVINVALPEPFPRYTYDECLTRWGLDKPDLRFGMELIDLTESAQSIRFPVFERTIVDRGQVKGLVASGCATYSRKQRDELEAIVRRYNVGTLLWIAVETGGGVRSSFDKFASPSEVRSFVDRAGATEGDLLLLVADKPGRVARALGELRNHLARKLGLIPAGIYKPLWVTEFPMFEYDEENCKWGAMHHMFTQPKDEYLADFEQRPAEVKAHLYDVVINGVELGSGSIRITRPELQRRVMNFVGYRPELAEENFGFFIKAYEYGAPPHAGMALGLDNMVMVMLGLTNIQDVIAFPNNSSGVFPLDNAPGALKKETLEEIHMEVRKPPGGLTEAAAKKP